MENLSHRNKYCNESRCGVHIADGALLRGRSCQLWLDEVELNMRFHC